MMVHFLDPDVLGIPPQTGIKFINAEQFVVVRKGVTVPTLFLAFTPIVMSVTEE